MKVKLGMDERQELLYLLPFHGELKFMRIFEEFRKEIGFDEDELSEWGDIGVKEYEIGDNLRKEIIKQLKDIEFPTVIQDQIYNKLK